MSLMLEPREKLINKVMETVGVFGLHAVVKPHQIQEIKQRLDQDCFTYNDFLEVIQEYHLGVKLENYIIQKALNRNVD